MEAKTLDEEFYRLVDFNLRLEDGTKFKLIPESVIRITETADGKHIIQTQTGVLNPTLNTPENTKILEFVKELITPIKVSVEETPFKQNAITHFINPESVLCIDKQNNHLTFTNGQGLNLVDSTNVNFVEDALKLKNGMNFIRLDNISIQHDKIMAIKEPNVIVPKNSKAFKINEHDFKALKELKEELLLKEFKNFRHIEFKKYEDRGKTVIEIKKTIPLKNEKEWEKLLEEFEKKFPQLAINWKVNPNDPHKGFNIPIFDKATNEPIGDIHVLKNNQLTVTPQKSADDSKSNDFFKAVGYFQFGSVLTDDDINAIRQQAKTNSSDKTPMEVNIYKALSIYGKPQRELENINLAQIAQFAETYGNPNTMETSQIFSMTRGAFQFNPSTQKVEMTPQIQSVISNQIKKSENPAEIIKQSEKIGEIISKNNEEFLYKLDRKAVEKTHAKDRY